jgi:glycerol-3-phosphate dehydrogenase
LSVRGAANRERSMELLRRCTFDLLVIGGGIVGSRVALEASHAGLQVALVDAGDFGGATSSASGKLVHGGLRYLRAGRFRLVREALRERRVLATRVAPHLVRPLPVLLATDEAGRSRYLTVAAGPLAYWALGDLRRPAPRLFGAEPARAMFPALRTTGPCGLVEEAVTDDGRLTLATVKAAVRAGTVAANHARVVELRKERGGISGAILEGRDGEGAFDVRCRAVVNATGPWLDRVRLLEDSGREPAVRLSKGVHLVLPLEGGRRAAIALALRDGRHVYAVPWHGMLLVGTTDTPYEGDPRAAVPTFAEEAYLLEAASRFLPGELVRHDRVLCSFAGLRVLRPGDGATFEASREHFVGVGPAGMVSVAGGKLTTHRPIALDALRALPPGVRPRKLQPSLDPLPGSSPPDERVLRARLDAATARHLAELYGGEAEALLDYAARLPDALERVHPGGPDLWAQVHHAADEEWAMSVDDVVRRRTTLAVRGLDTEIVRAGISAIVGDGRPGLRPVISGPKSSNELRPS